MPFGKVAYRTLSKRCRIFSFISAHKIRCVPLFYQRAEDSLVHGLIVSEQNSKLSLQSAQQILKLSFFIRLLLRLSHWEMRIRVFYILAFLLFSYPFLQVARCQSDSDVEAAGDAIEEGSDLGIVGEDVQDFVEGSFSPAPDVETVCVFPKNPSRSVVAGEDCELLVGMRNEGESSVNVIAIKASIHLSYDHRMLVQNLSTQVFNNASVPSSAQSAFPYVVSVSKFLQAGTFDLVGTIVYEIDQNTYQSTFYNGTIEVTEASGPISVESVFLFCLGIALLGLLGLWIRGQIEHFSKKTKRVTKVEVGTKTTDPSMDEWLQGTAYTQSLSSKSKKKK